MLKLLLICCCLFFNFAFVFGAGPDEWKSRSIYFLLTDRFNKLDGDEGGCADLSNYCGGTFAGLQEQLDYIQGLGFDAIWITPVVENTPGGYHGYWAKDLYKINPFYGSSEELKELVNAAHERDMYVMVDVVANHVGYFPTQEEDYSIFPQFNKDDFHDCSACNEGCGPSDWDNKIQVEQCRLAGLPDLDTRKDNVKTIFNEWIKWLITEFQFDGMRIDTVKHVQLDFWKDFTEAAGVFSIGEIFSGVSEFLGGYKDSMDSLLSFPMYYTLNDVFASQQSMYLIPQRLEEYERVFPGQVDLLGTFLDNHDVPRFLSKQSNEGLFTSAITYVILGRGIPVVYYGTEKGFSGAQDPQNREILWPSGFDLDSVKYSKIISSANHVRHFFELWDEPQATITIQDDCYIFSRGASVIVALTNVISDSFSCPIKIQTNMCDISDSNFKLSQDSADVQFINGQPRVLVSCDKLQAFQKFFEAKFSGEFLMEVGDNLTTMQNLDENTVNALTQEIEENVTNFDEQVDSIVVESSSRTVNELDDSKIFPSQEILQQLNQPESQVVSDQVKLWKSRQIYQLLTDRFAPTLEEDETTVCEDLSDYCGGTFEGISRHLDYIQNLGFDAIWISPHVKNTEKGYHGYWAQNFSQVNPMFGDENSLQMMINQAHDRDMLVMLDVVANHVGYGPSGADFLEVFDPPFQPSNFHDCQECDSFCSIDNWDDAYQLVHCRVAGLPDLNQTDPKVRQFLLDWISETVTKYDFDGIRIDTVKHVDREFWREYSTAAGVFSIGEVFTFDNEFLETYLGTMDSLLSFPMSGILRGVFGEQQGMQLLSTSRASLISMGFDMSTMGVFLENHDLPRFLSYQPDTSLYINALAYVILGEGIPILYYGAEQGFDGDEDPANREPLWTSDYDTTGDLFQQIQTLTSIRSQKELWNEPMVELTVDDNCYSFARGSTLVVLNNYGSFFEPVYVCTVDVSNYALFDNEKELCDVLSDETISKSGETFTVVLDTGVMPKVFQICGTQKN
eukprot:TRINITY_DN24120_c1_g3_i5.p1 TRINITY_DN24120_c1_g3~~TRINITY_DN24120_c1_g3_i5.p1  ORF type:complete len:1017 (+),score=146.26 TRINITY_DN24120_c1_g3_i5:177-3227(+)